MRNTKGLTLIEVIISMAIFGIILVVFLNLFGMSNKNIFKTENERQVVYEIQEQINLKIEKIELDKDYGKDIETKNGVKIIIQEIHADIKTDKLADILSSESVVGKLIVGSKENNEIITFIPNKTESK